MDPAINQRVPLDIFDVVISHLQDVATMRSCALVCGSWNYLTRPYLFRGVVCRPAVPSRTFKNLLAFLSTLPNSGNFLRSVTIDGRTRNKARRRLELSVEEIARSLAQFPTATHITLRRMRLAYYLPSNRVDPYPLLHTSRSVEMLKIQDCIVLQDAIPFRRFLSYFVRIDALVLKDVLVESTDHPAELPSVEVQIRSILVCAVTASGGSGVLTNLFHGFEAPSSPLSLALSPRTGVLERLAQNDILSHFKFIRTLSVNVLSLSGSLNRIIEDQRRFPPLRHWDVPKEWVSAELCRRFSSIQTLVIYSTTTSSIHREPATLLYAAILANNWRLLSNAPTSLRHIELRFQRYGPHSRDTIEELRAIEEMKGPSPIRWGAVDAGTLARFPELESFTCVLCDGGFMDQWGPIEGLSATPRSVFSRQTEFDDYVVFLKDVLPRLQDEGRLQFRMSDV
ncbi:hypothetical protein K466DRAFT_384556 [Polyporus arcularius HHB13444]|uniref:F-box domain-containing protein n=1 Tax=Polyporus arcularius HHB13444 TaxID=1314778 RepID=A0A5C3PL27_9APHY|nr:hypothetical protein K466DRAFT_384556 [Polyporus arcularius HHB13444]